MNIKFVSKTYFQHKNFTFYTKLLRVPLNRPLSYLHGNLEITLTVPLKVFVVQKELAKRKNNKIVYLISNIENTIYLQSLAAGLRNSKHLFVGKYSK